MPQLIAMIIIVVGAMIYMFQTFGGTGDKISGIAQKTSVITEINNIKSGLQFAARAGKIADANVTVANVDYWNTLTGLANEQYFAELMNEQLLNDGTANNGVRDNTFNTYSAISFGGTAANAGTNAVGVANNGTGAMLISLVANENGAIPGIFVDLSRGSLANNAGFIESEIATDLRAIARIDRTAITANSGALNNAANTALERRTPADNGEGGTNNDGMFIIYFNDFNSNEVVVDSANP
ncbi:hypothetical protein AAX29_01656 [Aliarcobacter thereius]|uniref:Uncharacterized protein n=1 Tax=Aliarcobacter thereius TaxID=544718 RepID=A0A1C0B5T1_9BACT|nr:hypothetical protein [Aliarcobacter thereius]OCL98417.1 hypothetical protein AAX29_01656 [Aliarcobacter thereius]TLS70966.1 hypothetical protein FE246_08345 [Aliarcobacter thereius]TLT06452.1 hypothetical protein FE243_07635 [Aliarcobacter thereius]